MKKKAVKKKTKLVAKTSGRFSDLEKLRIMAKAEMKKENFAMRSCWNCNPGHTRLKKAECVILCFGCGHYFYKGKDVTEK
jgi:ribosomal protein S27E